jgi:hypothetical protein
MNSLALAKDYLRKATVRLEVLNVLYERESFDDVVREAQEIVELVLKGILRCLGIDPPRRHDVAPLLRRHQERLPVAWQEKLEWIESVSAKLLKERSQAFYGDESGLIPASELYSEVEAKEAITWAESLVELYRELLNEISASQGMRQAKEGQSDEEIEGHEQPE